MKDRNYLPGFLQKSWEEPIKENCGKITDFTWLIQKVWCISNKEYQERIWVRHEDMDKIVDSYDDTIMYFVEDCDAIFEGKGAGQVEMTDNQYQMLRKLYDMVDAYDMMDDRPEDDKGIVNNPRWHKVRDYAKLVYEELTRESK